MERYNKFENLESAKSKEKPKTQFKCQKCGAVVAEVYDEAKALEPWLVRGSRGELLCEKCATEAKSQDKKL